MLSFLDEAAALYADRVAKNTFVTYKISEVCFLKPCKVGDTINFYARPIGATTSGLELEMRVDRVDHVLEVSSPVLTTKVVMVAVDGAGSKAPLRATTKYVDILTDLQANKTKE